MQTIAFAGAGVLTLLGLYGLITSRNCVKIVICFNMMETAALIFLIALGYREGGTIPIIHPERDVYVDPLPHALALTAIVIGASLTALMLAHIARMYEQYKTLNIDRMRRLRG
ncbi:MAG: cation:proton antiporter [Spirochaetaceae bacterium]|nr:MAG: cation:proton antiporter [Spirochaetaceae bacterium]